MDPRRAALAERLRRRGGEQGRGGEEGSGRPLSYPQRRLWFLDQLNPAAAVYVVPLTFRVTGPLDADVLGRALTEVVRRHQVLRSVFRVVDGLPQQFVRSAGEVVVGVRDVSCDADPADSARRLRDEEARRPFDLSADLMIRPLLVRVAPDDHWLCLTLHHIACDGWSLGLLGGELSELYRALAAGEQPRLPVLPRQYADFAERQVDELAGDGGGDLLGYWREHLAGMPALATLPTDRTRPPTQSYAGDHLEFDLDPALTAAVAELARVHRATPFAVLLAAFAGLVHAYTGGEEVIVGSPVAARPTEEQQRLIGFFANTVVQRLDTSGRPTFGELVARAREESRAAVAHEELPFEKLVEELAPNRDPAHNPLFQLMFSYHEGDGDALVLPGCQVTMVPGDTGTAKFDLTLSITRAGENLRARLEYSTALFEPATARALGDQFRTVLAAAVDDPELPVGRLPVLSAAERRRLLVDGNPPVEPAPDGLIHDQIVRQARRTPDAPALLGAAQSPDDALTFRELDRRTDELAARLRAHGVRPDVPVGVHLRRTPDLVIALVAILKAGGGYLPLDPGYPAERLAFMVGDSGTPVVLTSRSLARGLADLPVVVLSVDTLEPAAGRRPEADLEPEQVDPSPAGRPDQLAYLIYTSGSTGRPKGVMVSHRNVLNFFAGMDGVLGADEPATWLAVTSVSFDISVLELLWTLARGHRVVVRGDEPTASAAAGRALVPSSVQARPMDFSLFYFGGDRGGEPGDAYRLLMEGARFADRNGFRAVWTPERHFHEFGGLYPNPSVTASAVAAITEHVDVRAGSVVMPLHDPLRVAEEWSVVDNISRGRVGLSVASGWQPDDFVLAPDRYADRKNLMMRGIEDLRTLWRGGSLRRRNGAGADVDVRIFPPPIQAELPVWVTSARSAETFQLAGAAGAGLLTHLLGHTAEQLAEKIDLYRKSWRDAGHPGTGHVTLMLHTFVGPDAEETRRTVREPLCAYVKSSFDLLSGLSQAMGREVDPRSLPERELDELIAQAFDRFFDTSGLLGTPEHCADLVDRLKAIGVDEVACLVDFGVAHDQVLAALEHLASARELSEERRRIALADEPIATQLRRHGVTHLQCTPSVAALLGADEPSASAVAALRRLLVGGEALPEPLAGTIAGLVPGRAHNMYGPTEATVWATTAPISDGPVTIGRPLSGVQAYVVDAYLRPTPVNVPGELLVGGPNVARGYLGRPTQTAERFVPDPFSGVPGARLYRTGDLVRRRASGELDFLGRLDHQVKVHGHRIELGEIDNVLASHPGLSAAVTVVRGEEALRRLVAYCVPARADADRAGGPRSATAVRTFAARVLPDYMVPADVVFLDDLPKTPNGKIDRGRLPDVEARPPTDYQPPAGDTERRAAEVVAEVLRAERVGVEDNFFEVGGNSLLAVQARARLLPVLGERLTLVDIFRYPTVRGLVAALTAGSDDTAEADLAQARDAAGRRAGAFARQARRPRGRGGVQ